MHKEPFVTLPDGRTAYLFTLRHAEGSVARITNYGGTLVSLEMPDGDGRTTDVVLGLPSPADWLGDHPALNTLIGRYGNRIAHGRFELGGQVYELACNLGAHHLHGGPGGFHKVLWEGELAGTPERPQLRLHYLSADGEEGYPGNLMVTVTYTLEGTSLRLDYEARTDAATVLNLTHHGYFNLAGTSDVLDHELRIAAEAVTEVDADLIPTGRLRPVEGTPFDFRDFHRIGDRMQPVVQRVVDER
ncbi:MAG: galactose mutarotase, partial [Bacteroidetes bacterium]